MAGSIGGLINLFGSASGWGYSFSARIVLSQGDVLSFIVGQRPQANFNEAAGGGATFVLANNGTTPLFIAGGGGGAAYAYGGQSAQGLSPAAPAGGSGGAGFADGSPGLPGLGGNGGDGNGGGGGGGTFGIAYSYQDVTMLICDEFSTMYKVNSSMQGILRIWEHDWHQMLCMRPDAKKMHMFTLAWHALVAHNTLCEVILHNAHASTY